MRAPSRLKRSGNKPGRDCLDHFTLPDQDQGALMSSSPQRSQTGGPMNDMMAAIREAATGEW